MFCVDQDKTDENPAFWRPLGGKATIADSVPEEEGQLYIRLYRYGHNYMFRPTESTAH
jgi:hypothetical protein